MATMGSWLCACSCSMTHELVRRGVRDLLWAEDDPVLPFSVGERIATQLNFPAPRPIADASHFLQEDAGPEIGAIIADWLRS